MKGYKMDLIKHIKPLSGESDWPLWKHKIRDILDYHEGALDSIDGKITKPEPLAADATTAQTKEHKEKSELYRKANSYAKSMITSAVTDAVYQKIMDKETARDAWEALKQHFEASSKDQLFKICTDFFAFSWTIDNDVSTHIAKLRSLWNELNNGLRAKGVHTLPDLLLVCKTLQILPKSFETFRSSWMLLTKEEEKTFDELTNQLCMFERNFTKIESEKTMSEALVVKTGTQKKDNSKTIPFKKQFKKNGTCNYCSLKGHWIRECKKWIADGRPPKNKTSSNSQNKVKLEDNTTANVALISICNEVCTIEADTENWWIDNGATKHVTNRSDFFIEYTKFQNLHNIKAAGEECLIAEGKGKIKIASKVGEKLQETTLTDVWYVPKISKNLFSVIAAQDKNPESEFKSSPTKCWLKVNEKVMVYGEREIGGSLFKAAIIPIVPKAAEVNKAVADNSTLQLYHERWGHQDKRHIKALLEKELGRHIKLDTELCEPCIYGKAHRLPFGTRKQTEMPGELISTDVCGPFNESFGKKRYLVVFKDSYTKFRYGYFIREKLEVKDVLKNMLAHAKARGHRVKEILSDNGGEFDNEEVRKTLHTEGIMQRLTAPYTPQQNGGSERENRTIIEMARTFKYTNPEAGYPPAIWAELVKTAIYVLNRTGKSSIVNVSPYELWMGRKPRTSHLRIISSTCFVHIPSQRRKKMDKKATKGYLVGYDGDERYRIWIKEDHKVILSRDVKFLEKPGGCEQEIEVTLKDVNKEQRNENESDKEDEDKDNKRDENEYNEEEIKEENYEDEDDNDETTIDTESEGRKEKRELSQRNLRNRLSLRRPSHLDDYVMLAENPVGLVSNPETYTEAINSQQCSEWRRAMEKEISSLKENQTWKLVPLPKGTKALPCKWVFRLKQNPDGSIERYKARLVVKGFGQRRGVDYNQTFSPVARMSTIRSILSIAASEKMHLAQFDVSTAFLYGELEETIYIAQPEGFNDGTDKVCKLNKSLYGLKQAPRCWNRRFGNFMQKLGFKSSHEDPCLYIRKNNGHKLVLVLYVDDGLIAATNPEELKTFLLKLKTEFKITTTEATYFLGLQIDKQEDGGIKITQESYAHRILERFNFAECRPVSTPMLKGSEIEKSGKEKSTQHDFPYRQAVGALMYLMLGTRPDLAYSIGYLSRSLENPSIEDVTRVKRVLRYVAGTLNLGILYRPNFNKAILECYSDADFGGCLKTGRSTSGTVVIYAGGAISWISQRQAIVATSTTEAELVAASEATKEIIWLSRLINEIRNLKEIPILQVDNSAAVRLAENPEFHRRTKHIAIKHFFVREKVSEGQLTVQQISTEKQIADIMTKALSKTRQQILCNFMGLI